MLGKRIWRILLCAFLIIGAFSCGGESSGGSPAEVSAPAPEEYDIGTVASENPVTGTPVSAGDSDLLVESAGYMSYLAGEGTAYLMAEQMGVNMSSRAAYPISDITGTIDDFDAGSVDYAAAVTLELTGDFAVIISNGLSQFLVDEFGFVDDPHEGLIPPDGPPAINDLNGVATLILEESLVVNNVVIGEDDVPGMSGTTISGDQNMTAGVGADISHVTLIYDEVNPDNSTVSGRVTVFAEMHFRAGLAFSGEMAGYLMVEMDASGSATATMEEIMAITELEDPTQEEIFDQLSQEPTYSIAGTATLYASDGVTVIETIILDEDYLMELFPDEGPGGGSSSPIPM